MLYERLIRPALFKLDPETAHGAVLSSLACLRTLPFSSTLLSSCFVHRDPALESVHFGRRFSNPVGLAAGYDKDCLLNSYLAAFGFGFVECGTVTPLPQEGNPRPRLFRLPEAGALINRMGFNNCGGERAAAHLAQEKRRAVPVGINIGKGRQTPLEEAAGDYLFCLEKLHPFADYFALNVSSPNTPGLRRLQNEMDPLLSALQKKNGELAAAHKREPAPIFVKVAPDLEGEDLDRIAECCIKHRITGIIATNTTLSRAGVPIENPIEGGLSGRPLEKISTEAVRRLFKSAKKKLVLIGVGGVSSAADAYRKIRAGASLVQVYTGWIYGGPGSIGEMNRNLAALIRRDGFKNIEEAVGVEG